MRLRNMLRICLAFWKSEPQYAYKRYAYKKHVLCIRICSGLIRECLEFFLYYVKVRRFLTFSYLSPLEISPTTTSMSSINLNAVSLSTVDKSDKMSVFIETEDVH